MARTTHNHPDFGDTEVMVVVVVVVAAQLGHSPRECKKNVAVEEDKEEEWTKIDRRTRTCFDRMQMGGTMSTSVAWGEHHNPV
jgi:hypothetical protein